HGLFVPRDAADRRKVGGERKIAVTTLPRSKREAVNSVHVHVRGEQVAAALNGVVEELVDKESRVETLPLEAPLHVRNADNDGVDLVAIDEIEQLVAAQSTRG